MHVPTTLDHIPALPPREAPQERKRRPSAYPRLPRNLDPTEWLVIANGKPAVIVALSGGKAGGASMLLDRETWAWVSQRFGRCWIMMSNGHGDRYVATTRRDVSSAAHQNGSTPTALLARLIAGRDVPLGRRVVRFRNGDALDLRDANLAVMSREDAKRWRLTDPHAVVHADDA